MRKLILNEDLFDDVTGQDSPPQNATDVGLANLIIDLINGEWDTISDYNDLLSVLRDESREDFIPVIDDIVKEENVHVGQLQKMLQQISSNVSSIEKGEIEGEEQLTEELTDADMGSEKLKRERLVDRLEKRSRNQIIGVEKLEDIPEEAEEIEEFKWDLSANTGNCVIRYYYDANTDKLYAWVDF